MDTWFCSYGWVWTYLEQRNYELHNSMYAKIIIRIGRFLENKQLYL